MKITVEQMNGVVIAVPLGKHLDASNAKEFKCNMAPILETSTKVVCDLSQFEFVDSSGLGAIVSCLRQLKAVGGDLKLCGMTKPIRSLFELVRMHRIFDILDTREEAVRAF